MRVGSHITSRFRSQPLTTRSRLDPAWAAKDGTRFNQLVPLYIPVSWNPEKKKILIDPFRLFIHSCTGGGQLRTVPDLTSLLSSTFLRWRVCHFNGIVKIAIFLLAAGSYSIRRLTSYMVASPPWRCWHTIIDYIIHVCYIHQRKLQLYSSILVLEQIADFQLHPGWEQCSEISADPKPLCSYVHPIQCKSSRNKAITDDQSKYDCSKNNRTIFARSLPFFDKPK